MFEKFFAMFYITRRLNTTQTPWK